MMDGSDSGLIVVSGLRAAGCALVVLTLSASR
jgi:hypothetical protein